MKKTKLSPYLATHSRERTHYTIKSTILLSILLILRIPSILILLLACNPSTEKKNLTQDIRTQIDLHRKLPRTTKMLHQYSEQLCFLSSREEGSGPFPLDTYDMAKATAGMIEDSVTTRRMPPFHANNSGECTTLNTVYG